MNKALATGILALLSSTACAAPIDGDGAADTDTAAEELSVSSSTITTGPVNTSCLTRVGGWDGRGTGVELRRCDGRGAQVWSFSGDQIKSPAGWCLATSGDRSDSGAALLLNDCVNVQSRLWRLRGDGRILGVSDRCIDIRGGGFADGAIAQLYNCNGNSNQRFQIRLPQYLANFEIHPEIGHTKCFTNDRGNVVIRSCSGAASQKWTRDGNLLRSALGGCVAASGGTVQSYVPLVVQACPSVQPVRGSVFMNGIGVAAGGVELWSQQEQSWLSWDVRGESVSEGTVIQLYPRHFGKNQQFHL